MTSREIAILVKIVEWHDEWKQGRSATYGQPDTLRVTEYFKLKHADSLKMLNRLELRGWIEKRRRLSAGLGGAGYDGSLHSAVEPTEMGRAFVNELRARRDKNA